MVLAAGSCARLENNYLPPSGALQSGGGPGLAPPGRPGFGGGPGGPPFASQVSAGGFRPSGGAPGGGQNVAILSQSNVNNGDGSYSWR
ncbi:hypothetical protein EVAR_73368_1 [Eumeta japonica]|uniref:Uncharacterized protein n=1 Tax=Eumeta variegata TaxID=151549 RepID=A0A4C1SD85_EUMVA|nr:hypothetical protein EVAR_73368_1 [Eumeta japonica]